MHHTSRRLGRARKSLSSLLQIPKLELTGSPQYGYGVSPVLELGGSSDCTRPSVPFELSNRKLIKPLIEPDRSPRPLNLRHPPQSQPTTKNLQEPPPDTTNFNRPHTHTTNTLTDIYLKKPPHNISYLIITLSPTKPTRGIIVNILKPFPVQADTPSLPSSFQSVNRLTRRRSRTTTALEPVKESHPPQQHGTKLGRDLVTQSEQSS
ncbi:hypothetical protein PGT21_004359 [Puccinia graminis f. sp. tritici]|uniref:Uncharacterized protein n=1 Tax=Puccinia graminis f. sp. tritici TaxID=56615 RepID=A0A5B0NHP9_PUCGR|nr:hypothetical protein PGTUg99_029358 [Puccinia graminis f. sp. tritici]KAA1112635.1 hypothetical protein PGT21_004359 [Puccinia graminis f. sp. tritici]